MTSSPLSLSLDIHRREKKKKKDKECGIKAIVGQTSTTVEQVWY